ncbi:hypothetical protein [Pseudomonas juntendi]|uniref:hypothetical protein n=1 Tax=Pseudomonas juntendi TaxID=2666183 RepID=UPI001F2CF1C6|nr:hypothetical protein [Pseudomonas juntendi]
MSTHLSEEEMRRALFGDRNDSSDTTACRPAKAKSSKHSSSISSKIRVTLNVSNIYEGKVEVVTFDSSSLSRLVAEMDAKKQFQKKYRFVDVVSVERV